ncbi:type II secretion system protein [Victivallis sp.]|uniref:type II secretion system protein n=1 Tax=Victivallis sp. TaxID=2049020 RepID=UPI003A8DA1EC
MRHNFTLFELLLIVGVVALAAAMMHPMLSAARAAAEEAGCRSNLSLFSKASTSYSNDNDNWAITGYLGAQTGNWFHVFERSYGVNKDAFHCPADANYSFSSKGLNYGLNVLTFGETFNNNQKKVPHKVDEISKFGRNDKLIMFIDTPPVCAGYNGKIRHGGGQGAYYESTSPVAPYNSASAYYPAYVRHSDNAEAMMFDGHVETLSVRQLTDERDQYTNPRVEQWRDGNLALRGNVK